MLKGLGLGLKGSGLVVGLEILALSCTSLTNAYVEMNK